MDYSEVLKRLCYEKDITLGKVEKDCKFANGSLRKLKDNMTEDRLVKLAKYFNVTPLDIVGLHYEEYPIDYVVAKSNGVEYMLESNTYRKSVVSTVSENQEFSREERALIKLYRNANDEVKDYVMDYLSDNIGV